MKVIEESILSKQAEEFLVKNPKYRNQLKIFEQDLEVGRDLKESDSLLEYIINDIYLHYEYDEDGYFVTFHDDDFYDPKVIDVGYYINKDNKLTLEVIIDWQGDTLTAFGNSYDYDWYQEPEYEEQQVSVSASAHIDIIIPEDPRDYDSYTFITDVEYYSGS